ncbi:gamma-tubulin complex component 2-like isoform X1 [Leptotrombidium deliense]|uniref:Gamma-tubulin complex component n=1 Tax=Leptotrombidium deliense TaxID=299467 RepID=A0A443SHK1_9ACAR|nr:gamma-tubulin complex component 2-like isoform X1 [Leptotrombidium deliense]
MSEFNIVHDVDNLLKRLSVNTNQKDCPSKGSIVEMFEKSRNDDKKMSSNVKVVERMSKRSALFKDRYLDLKSKNVIETDGLVNLLSRIEEKSELGNYLRYHKFYENHKKEVNVGTEGVSKSLASLKSLENILNQMPVHHLEPLTIVTDGVEQSQYEFKSDDILRDLTYDFVDDTEEIQVPVHFSSLSKDEKEIALINDLFYVLIGISGVYISIRTISKRRKIFMAEDLDVFHRTLCQRITRICPLYSQLVSFMERHEFEDFTFGMVNQALVSCIRQVIGDYFRHLSEIEMVHKRGKLTLQKMWYFVESNIANFDILCDVCEKVKRGKCVGGAVISILHEKILLLRGNAKACEFLVKITSVVCAPYFDMLLMWLTEGTVHDPYNEFCIEDKLREEDCDELRSDAWKDRYSVINCRIPIFLSKYSNEILRTGKYLSIIKQFGQKLEVCACDKLQYTVDERLYGIHINAAYISSNRQMYRLLMDDYKLIEHLKAIKSYFFMDKGDFIVHFMEIAAEQLNKNIDDINITAVQSLLELSVRTSVLANNSFTDNLCIEFADESLLSQVSNLNSQGCHSMLDSENVFSDSRALFGFESLMFTYRVEWPLSLILHKGSIGFYQMLFRLLFIFKFVERSLGDLWKFNKTYKSSSLKSLYSRCEVFGLQQKMLSFVQNFEYYLMFEVIEPKFVRFISAVETKIENFDEMLREHESFCELLSKDCMLSNVKALNFIASILDLCLEFTNFLNSRNHFLDTERLTKLNTDFNENLNNLLNEISDAKEAFNTNLVDILCKLDFNEFYSNMKNSG